MGKGATVTTGELLLSLSALNSGTTLELIQSVNSSGDIIWLPIQSISVDIPQAELRASLTTKIISADIIIQSIDADIPYFLYETDITQTTLDGDL